MDVHQDDGNQGQDIKIVAQERDGLRELEEGVRCGQIINVEEGSMTQRHTIVQRLP